LSALAFGLVLTAALGHATWNLFAKRSSSGIEFVWLFSAVSALVLLAPAVVSVGVSSAALGASQALFILGSGALHIAYFVLLQRGYNAGEMSLVYPSARGTGVLAATVGGVTILGERPGALALAGATLVVIGVIVAGAGAAGTRVRWSWLGLGYGVATGCVIGVYTLWDKHAVDALAIPPLFYYWGFDVVVVLGLAPLALRHRGITLRAEWSRNARAAIGVGILAPASYVLVLYALVTTPVSFVAPVRETAIVFGSAMGVFLLREGNARVRLTAAAIIATGVVLLAVG
jgi:drug/metabolite transporter (DMT)-like permease